MKYIDGRQKFWKNALLADKNKITVYHSDTKVKVSRNKVSTYDLIDTN